MSTAYVFMKHFLTPNGPVFAGVHITSDAQPSVIARPYQVVWSEITWARTEGKSFHEAEAALLAKAKRDSYLGQILALRVTPGRAGG